MSSDFSARISTNSRALRKSCARERAMTRTSVSGARLSTSSRVCGQTRLDGAAFYGRRYRRDIFTHKFHPMAIELSQSRSDPRARAIHRSMDIRKSVSRACLRADWVGAVYAYRMCRCTKKNICAPSGIGKTGAPTRRISTIAIWQGGKEKEGKRERRCESRGEADVKRDRRYN